MASPELGSASESFSQRSDSEAEEREKVDGEEGRLHSDEEGEGEAGALEDEEKEERREEVEEVVMLIKNLTTLYDLSEEDWIHSTSSAIRQYVLEPSRLLLVIFYKDLNLVADFEFPYEPIHDCMYFMKSSEAFLTANNFFELVTFGNITGSIEGAMLKTSLCIFAPALFKSSAYTEGFNAKLKKQYHEFFAHATDSHYKLHGFCALYVPQDEGYSSIDESAKDKDYVRRLEGVVNHWSKQLGVAVNDISEISSDSLLTPIDEYNFWEYRWKMLKMLMNQLFSPEVRKVIDVLFLSQSSYLNHFTTQVQEITEAVNEAASNMQCLELLLEPCRDMESERSPDDIAKHIPKLLNLIRCLWLHSQFYNSPNHLVPLCQNLCHQVILKCQSFVNVNGIFDEFRIKEAVKTLEANIRCCRKFRIIYEQVASHHTSKNNEIPWNFDVTDIFNNMNAFVRRNHDLIEVCNAMRTFLRRNEFGALEKPLLGGTKGFEHMRVLNDLETQFKNALARVADARFDILNVLAPCWLVTMPWFRGEVRNIERQLENLLVLSFEQATTVEEGLICLHAFFHYHKLPGISRLMDEKTTALWQMLIVEIDSARNELFVANPWRSHHAPPFAGPSLNARLFVNKLNRMKKMLEDAEWLPVVGIAQDALNQLQCLESRVATLMKQRFEKWSDSVEDEVLKRLDRPLFRRSSSRPGLLETNFDMGVCQISTEGRYWELLGFTLPHPAKQLMPQWPRIRRLYQQMLCIVCDYNSIISALTDEERLLLKELIKKVELKLSPGLFRLTWKTEVTDDFTFDCSKQTLQLIHFVKKYKKALMAMTILCEKMCDTKLIRLPSGKVFQVMELEQSIESYRTKALIKLIQLYQDLLKELTVIYEGLEDVLPQTGVDWHNFILKLDAMMEEALVMCVTMSMQIMIGALNGDAALIKVSLDLEVVKDKVQVTFSPPLGRVSSIGNHFLAEIVGAFKVIPRIYDKLGLHGMVPKPFHVAIENNQRCIQLQGDINKAVARNVYEIQSYMVKWAPYREMWERDKDEVIAAFEEKQPSAADWDKDIAKFGEVAAAVGHEEAVTNVEFTLLDATPLKMAIVNLINEWQSKIHSALLKQTEGEMDKLLTYYREKTEIVNEEPKAIRDLEVMVNRHEALMNAVEEQEAAFPKIESYFNILANYDVKIPQNVAEKRSSLPIKWQEYLKALNEASQMLDEKKEMFRDRLLEQSEQSKLEIQEVLQEFTEVTRFTGQWTPIEALLTLVKFDKRLQKLEEQETQLRNDLSLFGVSYPENSDLRHMQEDLETVTTAWSVAYEWGELWASYKDGNFWTLDTDAMEDQTLEISKTLARHGAELADRGWTFTNNAKVHVESVRRCIPLISQLKNPALRERHWKKIRLLARREFDPTSTSFTLGAVLDMRLQDFVQEIHEISKAASLELHIENGLQKIDETWSGFELSVEPFKEMKGIYRLKDVDDIFQTLEDNLSSLAAMKGTKFVEPFLNVVIKWEKTLTAVDEVLELLLTVQRQWLYLENIFTGEDIRTQLPEETELYEQLTEDWRNITSVMNQLRNAVQVSVHPGLQDKLTMMIETLEHIQRALTMYLEVKRHKFPRFYFISNDDLLEILGNSKKPELIQPHFKKLFDNIAKVRMGRNQIGRMEGLSMISADGESIDFTTPITCEGAVELWLCDLEGAMKATLRPELKSTRAKLKKLKKDKWLKEQPGQLCIVASQIQWTIDCTRALMANAALQDRLTVRKLRRKLKKGLRNFSEILRTNLTKSHRIKVTSLVTIEIHAADVVDGLYKSNCMDTSGFAWYSQLRFYWDKMKDDCIVRQTNTCFDYGYEYLGNSGRLAVTPLTDRCYITLTTALHLHRGGSPKGPAGTGKTETVKDLGKGLGAFVIVFNCSEGLDYKSMGRLFSGLAQTGAWGCFDEFNRINIEVLSVVAQQILSILSALSSKMSNFNFEGDNIRLVNTCGIFITMNPGYAGRTELPDNLKAMFRPIAMIVPDSAIIAEVTLFGEGFIECRSLANKSVTLLKLASQQFSEQDHYDFGLRSLVSLLRYAGVKRRMLLQMSDEEILLIALRDMNVSKLTAGDLRLFSAICSDLFPGVDTPVVDQSMLEGGIADAMKKAGLQPVSPMIKKVIQLYETQQSRHSVMLVGATLTGKSTTWKMLKAAMTSLQEEGYPPVQEYSLNPKTLSLGEMFGEFNLATGEWLDGVVSTIMRKICAEVTVDRKWLIFDGPVDAVWIENMNSAMDDNKMLTLINSERIAMPEQVSFLFEVENLKAASPATVSRAAMVYTDYKSLGWKPFVDSWLKTLKSPVLFDELNGQFNRLLERVLEFKRLQCTQMIPVPELACVRTLCRLIEGFFSEENDINALTNEALSSLAKLVFLFCLTWSVGGALDAESRRRMDTYIRESESAFPVKGLIYDYYVDCRQHSMLAWETQLDEHWKYNSSLPFHQLIVPTVDTVRYELLVSSLLTSEHAPLIVGPVGAGKTCVINRILNQRTETTLISALSAQTSAPALQELIESRLEKRTKGVFGPTGGKRLILFLDDLNMPSPDIYGSQPPLELLRTWMDYGFWFDRLKQTRKFIKDVTLVAAMGPVGGGRNSIPNRLLSRFCTMVITFPEQDEICHIYQTLLHQHVVTFEEEVKVIVEPITHMTVDLFTTVSETMLPTPNKTHYLFNLRDVSRVFQGLLRSHKNLHNTPKQILRLWVHEVHRVFSDRLIDIADRKLFTAMVDRCLGTYFEDSLFDICPDRKLPLFGDFINEFGIYEDLVDLVKLRHTLEEITLEHNKTVGVIPLKIVFFKDAIEHICRILRVLSQPRGHLLLVGIGGSGRTILSRLALHILHYRYFSLSLTRNYRVNEFREDLKLLYRQTGVENRSTGFLLNESEIISEDFLEIVNCILGTGEVTNLFKLEDLEEMRNYLSDAAAKHNIVLTSENVLNFVLERSRNSLHVLLCLNPAKEEFRRRLQRYPALVGYTTIDWFLTWPEEALMEVALNALEPVSFSETLFMDEKDDEENVDNLTEKELRVIVSKLLAEVHGTAEREAILMARQMQRITYITATNFLHLIDDYIKFLVGKREGLRLQAKKLKSGLGRIEEARESVEFMTIELGRTSEKVAEMQEECEASVQVVQVKRKEADERAKVVKTQTERIAEEEVACRALARAAQDDLDEALPAVEEALAALEALSKKDISELKSYGRPPSKVMMVMEAVCILKGVTPDWAESKRLLGEQDFLKSLREYDKDNIPDKIMKKIAAYTSLEEFSPDSVGAVSLAAQSLCMWVLAIESYGKLWRVVGPKKARLDEAVASLRRKQEEVSQLTSQLDELMSLVGQLNDELNVKTIEMEAVKGRADNLQMKLDRAAMLVDGFAGEKTRWETTVASCETKFLLLPGDGLVAAAFLTYAGPFVPNFRESLVSRWMEIVSTEPGVMGTPDLKILELLVDPALVRDWNAMGLPSDDYSIQNGILVSNSSHWPVVIDPQSQANKWIKCLEAKNGLTVVDLEDKDLLLKLEKCIIDGKPMLLQNVRERLDPSLAPVLTKALFIETGEVVLKLGDKLISYNENFRFYVTTKLSNPHFPPEVSTKAVVVNFALKLEGVQAQMLALVVRRERPELEESKTKTLQTISNGRKTLFHLEEELLQLLYETEGSLLENEKLFETLQTSKVTSRDVKESLQSAVVTDAEIDVARLEYLPCAERAAILFMCISDLSHVDPMYQFSLDAYHSLFSLSLEKSTKSTALSERIVNINIYHTYAVYKNTCRVLFSHHKLLFAFYMCINILKAAGKVQTPQFDYIIRGGMVLSREGQAENPNPSWITDNMWDNVNELEKLKGFQGLIRSFQDDTRGWQTWYLSKTPESAPLVGAWGRVKDVGRLLFVRALREDRFIISVRNFVEDKLGRPFIEQPVLDVKSVFEDSSPRVPLIFILSPGEDPVATLMQLAESKGMKKTLLSLSLGQGQSVTASRYIAQAIEEGRWVFLANCHLARSWMPALDKIVEDLRTLPSLHPDFRLWLSSSPDECFPISILQDGLKMTTQSPTGIRANLSRLLGTISDAQYARSHAPRKYQKLIFALAFFHGILLGRRKFEQLGWNVIYPFNDSDFEVSEKILGMYLNDDDEEAPWDALHYLIAQVNYGGHVTDEWDRRVLMTYAAQYFCKDALIQSKYRLSQLPIYFIPDEGHSQEAVKDYISGLPVIDPPEAFGQHANAEFSYLIAAGNDLCKTLMTMNAQEDEIPDTSREAKVTKVIQEIVGQLPTKLNLEETEKSLGELGPLEVVLLQESGRYNLLLNELELTLRNVQLGIEGRVLMTADLEAAFNCLLNGKVPPSWSKVYPSLKLLGSWTRDLFARIEFITSWANSIRPPILFWAVAFTFPTGFLTAVLQKASRARNVAVDNLAWEFSIISSEEAHITDPPSEGIFIRGLFLQGAGWDKRANSLAEPLPMQLVIPMPVIWLRPTEITRKKGKGTYVCPTYYYPIRSGSFVVAIDLPTGKEPPETWIKCGTALLLSTA